MSDSFVMQLMNNLEAATERAAVAETTLQIVTAIVCNAMQDRFPDNTAKALAAALEIGGSTDD